jgi:hypothetical protein
LVDVKTRVLPKSIAIKTEKSPLYFARARAPIAVRLVAIVALLWVDVLAVAAVLGTGLEHEADAARAVGVAHVCKEDIVDRAATPLCPT